MIKLTTPTGLIKSQLPYGCSNLNAFGMILNLKTSLVSTASQSICNAAIPGFLISNLSAWNKAHRLYHHNLPGLPYSVSITM